MKGSKRRARQDEQGRPAAGRRPGTARAAAAVDAGRVADERVERFPDEVPAPGGVGDLATDRLRSRAQVARAVADARLERGLSQQQLADLAGTTQARISQIEQMSGNIRFDTLERVAHALSLTVLLAPIAGGPAAEVLDERPDRTPAAAVGGAPACVFDAHHEDQLLRPAGAAFLDAFGHAARFGVPAVGAPTFGQGPGTPAAAAIEQLLASVSAKSAAYEPATERARVPNLAAAFAAEGAAAEPSAADRVARPVGPAFIAGAGKAA